MSDAAVTQIVERMAGFPGVQGCAVVESDSGMVWYHAGALPDIESTGEAGVEFWRVPLRLSADFKALGALQSAAYSFTRCVVALFPCSDKPALVLVCVADKKNISWNDWSRDMPALKKALAVSLGPAVAA